MKCSTRSPPIQKVQGGFLSGKAQLKEWGNGWNRHSLSPGDVLKSTTTV